MRTFLRLVGGLFLVFAAGVGGLLLWSWAPDVPADRLKARWAAPPSQFVSIDGMDVHFRDEGPRDDPAPLLLLHGMSSSLHTWDGWAERLLPTRRVIRLDLPGFGLTGPWPAGAPSGTGAYGPFLLAFLDRLGVGRAVIAGNSYGGEMAWQLALTAPDRVVALVLVDAAGFASRPGSVPLAFRIAQMPPFNRLFDVVLPRSLIESSLRNVYGDPAKVTPDLVDLYFDMAVRAGNRRALATSIGRGDPGPGSDRIAAITQPTLIIWGGRDRLIPPDAATRFHQAIAGSSVALFPDLGHVPQEEDPARTVAALESFLAGVAPR